MPLLACCRKPKNDNAPRTPNLKVGLDRLFTFHNYPDSARALQDPLTLAEAGFYYRGVGDQVKCAFCKLVLKNWSLGDIPILAHFKNRRYCDFIQGYNVGNKPIVDDPVRGRNPLLPNYDVICGCGIKEKRI